MKAILLSSLFLLSGIALQGADYVGDAGCAKCHPKEVGEWKGSQHERAMMKADAKSVQGDFNDSSFDYNGIVTTFYKKEGKFMVRTDGEDGKLHDYPIAYTFGVYPLQQYMVKFPRGRVQVLDIAWDSRSKSEGGQRWFHIHKDDNVTAGDVLHWTGPNLNWNYMCADCHSTNFRKNYDPKTRSYHTTYDVINVSCEACHGPASEHLKWTEHPETNTTHHGFPLSLSHKGRVWDLNTTSLKSTIDRQELEVCAKCHSRRSQLDDDYRASDRYSDHYLSVTLDEGLYFPDGKIEDEVYVYNSFRQSRMYEKGVTCSDCHNPHTLQRKAPGDAVCYQCHKQEKYTSKSHHFHEEGSKGASCISCHMPPRTYMGVDSRNDHSFRIPRPDISVKMSEVPNVCNHCHADKDARWAADTVKKWYGKTPVGKQNFAPALHSLRQMLEDAPGELYGVLTGDAPDIAKMTVTGYLGDYPSRQTYLTTLQMLRNSQPLMRHKALEALGSFPARLRIKESFKALSDPSKIVRMEAARQLAAFPTGSLDAKQKAVLQKALDEYKSVLLFNADRPEYQLALARFYLDQRQKDKAEAAFKEALALQPKFVPAYVSYSDFLTGEGKSDEAFALLQKGLKESPGIAVLHHALGLWYVRKHEKQKALSELKRATQLDPDNARFAYVYAVAIGEKDPQKAISILERVYARHTGNPQLLSALAYYSRILGDSENASFYGKKMKDLQNFPVR
ncbi:multiheme c-type cytochrome [Nitratifractor sp.]